MLAGSSSLAAFIIILREREVEREIRYSEQNDVYSTNPAEAKEIRYLGTKYNLSPRVGCR